MIDPRSYTLEHVEEMRANTKVDRQILERSIYALGLLEALVRVGAPITFKGGSSLMLLLDHPMRLSTDIDVVVPPGTDIVGCLEDASAIFPFESMEEQVRRGRNGIEKRHFKFYYASPVTRRRFHIFLDVVFEEKHYARIEGRPIANDLLIVDDEPVMVEMPTADCILGDKLTAFAPHATGIPFGMDKELEVIKQMYDISTLSRTIGSFGDVRSTFEKTAAIEISYRGLEIGSREVLEDAIESAACVAGRGRYNKDEYPLFLDGIRSITNHIFGERFSAERAVGHQFESGTGYQILAGQSFVSGLYSF
ncbi:MAG: nucleotidyl transferase AbiEii/AbiGii toxin family protein [Atopobiaceae bacterium]|nr:nucleotidyl transferase AbiEii/AbiGii toxin family protein [Atopobiaceae bacterium]